MASLAVYKEFLLGLFLSSQSGQGPPFVCVFVVGLLCWGVAPVSSESISSLSHLVPSCGTGLCLCLLRMKAGCWGRNCESKECVCVCWKDTNDPRKVNQHVYMCVSLEEVIKKAHYCWAESRSFEHYLLLNILLKEHGFSLLQIKLSTTEDIVLQKYLLSDVECCFLHQTTLRNFIRHLIVFHCSLQKFT